MFQSLGCPIERRDVRLKYAAVANADFSRHAFGFRSVTPDPDFAGTRRHALHEVYLRSRFCFRIKAPEVNRALPGMSRPQKSSRASPAFRPARTAVGPMSFV